MKEKIGSFFRRTFDSFFLRAPLGKLWKQYKHFFFGFMLLNLIKNSILTFILAILAYMQGSLWKKQLITSLAIYRKSEKYYMHRFSVL